MALRDFKFGNIDASALSINGTARIDSNGKFIGPIQSTNIVVDNLTLDGNTISSTDTNGSIFLSTPGTGYVQINKSFDASGGGWGTPVLSLYNTGATNGHTYLQLVGQWNQPGGDPAIQFNINGANGWLMGVDNSTTNDDFCLGGHIGGFDYSKLFTFGKATGASDLNIVLGALQTNGTTRIDNSGNASFATLTLSSVPTSDPHIAGRIWRSGTALQISLG